MTKATADADILLYLETLVYSTIGSFSSGKKRVESQVPLKGSETMSEPINTGWTPDAPTKPATKLQLIALRDHLLGLGLYGSAAAVDNAIDCIQQDADLSFRLQARDQEGWSQDETDLGTHTVISGGEVLELTQSRVCPKCGGTRAHRIDCEDEYSF